MVILVAIFLVSSGLCGVTYAFADSLDIWAIVFGGIELLAMGTSLLCILVMLVILPFRLSNQARERRQLAEAATGYLPGEEGQE
jgi:hypothetical protein